jgi:hypothetical protein
VCSSGSSRFELLRSKEARQQQQQQQQNQPPQQQQQLSKAAKKNLARTLKRQQQQQQQPPAASSTIRKATNYTAVTVATAASQARNKQQQQHKIAQDADVWTDVGAKRKAAVEAKQQRFASPLQQQLQELQQQPAAQLIQQCKQGASFTAQPAAAAVDSYNHRSINSAAAGSQGHGSAAAAAGWFAQLPRDAMLGVLCLLQPADVAALSVSCKFLQAACDDGALWQSLMAQSFPAHKLKASCLQDWKVRGSGC